MPTAIKDSSGLNQVECWFALLSERALRRAVHRSTRELEQAIREFVDAHNADPKSNFAPEWVDFTMLETGGYSRLLWDGAGLRITATCEAKTVFGEDVVGCVEYLADSRHAGQRDKW